jgi:hypothetical protein
MPLRRKRAKTGLREKVKVRKRVPVPEKAEQFERKHLTPIAGQAYLRLSQIYGVPLKELLPFRTKRDYSVFSLTRASYDPFAHEIKLKPRASSRVKALLFKREVEMNAAEVEEELLHSLQYLLSQTKTLREIKKYYPHMGLLSKAKVSLYNFTVGKMKRTFASLAGKEPSAKVHLSKPELFIDSQAYVAPLMLLAIINPKLGLPAFIAGSAWGTYLRYLSKEYFRRHGADGLILLFADPPKNWNMAKLRERERFFVENGFLEEKGGLTRKGIRYLHEKLPRDALLENVRLMRNKPDGMFERALARWRENRKRKSKRK